MVIIINIIIMIIIIICVLPQRSGVETGSGGGEAIGEIERLKTILNS